MGLKPSIAHLVLLVALLLPYPAEAWFALAGPQELDIPGSSENDDEGRKRYWNLPRWHRPEAPHSVTIHGIFRGLYQSEVEQSLGLPARQGKNWAIYSVGQGTTVNVYYRSEVVEAVVGSQVEYEGFLLGLKGYDFPKRGYPVALSVQRDYSGAPASFMLRGPKLWTFPSLPAPGSDLKFLDLLQNRDPEIGRALLTQNPSLVHERLSPYGQTPLHLISGRGTLLGTELLLALGADPNSRSYEGLTPLHSVSSVEKAKALLEAGAELNPEDQSGRTPLVYALANERREVAWLLLERGAGTTGASGSDSICHAAKARFSDVVVELLRRGVSLPPLALHEAAAGGEPTIVALFLKLGADPNERDEFGRTPLHALARAGDDRPGAPCHFHREAIRLLTEAGAQPSLVDHTGKTPFEAATSHQEVRELLAEFEKDSGHDS